MSEQYEIDSKIAMRILHGRQKITIPMSKSEFIGSGAQDTINHIKESLPYVLSVHLDNAKAWEYLYNYYRGIQQILFKTKVVREEINHIVEENHAFEIVEFKKSFLYGEATQYIQKGNKNIKKIAKEVSKLNDYCENIGKQEIDKQLAEWQYIGGTSYRYVEQNTDDDEDSPFIMSIPDPRNTFVVYSNSIKEEVLFSGFIRSRVDSMSPLAVLQDPNLAGDLVITIYTDDFYIELEATGLGATPIFNLIMQNVPFGDKTEPQPHYPLLIKGNRIIEYPLNNARLGLIELVISGLDAINQIKSNDVDDIDQFVQSLIVFINQEVDPEEFKKLLAYGAIQVQSQDATRPADVKLLGTQLKHSETKIVTDDLYQNILTICGIPRLTDNSGGGDTGQASLISGGWTMATERAKQDIVSFKKADKKAQKLLIAFCRELRPTEFKSLSVSDLDVRFKFNTTTNLLVKTQGLMNMKSANVSPRDAFEMSNIFADSTEAYNRAVDYYGEDFWKTGMGDKSASVEDSEKKQDQEEHTTITDSDDPNQYDSFNLPDRTKEQS